MSSERTPLCVDLDGTLIRTDILHEMLVGSVRYPSTLARIPGLLASGRAGLKTGLGDRVPVAVEFLPYRETVVAWLRSEREAGRQLILVTASPERVALAINEHLGLFDEVMASSATENLRGKAKAEALVKRFGERGFDYVGNDATDLAVWLRSAAAILVDAPSMLREKVSKIARIEREFPPEGGRWRALVKELRPHQWSKNVLAFVPLLTARAISDVAGWMNAALVFLAFSAAASAIYVFNDLTDLSADREHPRKSRRPFASGALPISWGVVMAPLLLAVGVFLGYAASVPWLIVLYVALSTSYSLVLKELPLVDVFTLASLYTIRLYAGGEATGHTVTLWLLAFSGFLFLSLGMMKRVAELIALRKKARPDHSRRDYAEGDVPILIGFGCSAAFVASMVLALYVQAEFRGVSDRTGLEIWTIVPLILFWQCRMWLSTARGYMQDDPIVYAMRDWVSRLVVVALFVVFVAAGFTR